ncbi:hypothetical protein [Microcoleus sp. herbarium12]|uniref:hypothetical protein n=1 Tax=Microcoleus sp. herbarium12 TaxID=3055437 RepID=UPI002FD00673
MPDDNSNKNQDSRTQIILALIGLFGTVGVALIANWDKFFPPEPSTSVAASPVVRGLTVSPLPSVSTSPSPLVSLSPSPSVDRTVQSTWQFIGTASTGESVFVDSSSIKKSADAIDFTYRIGGEVLVARADCGGDRWYVNKYDKWYSPSSQAIQDMLSYVCR